jgi:hypothetical protein
VLINIKFVALADNVNVWDGICCNDPQAVIVPPLILTCNGGSKLVADGLYVNEGDHPPTNAEFALNVICDGACGNCALLENGTKAIKRAASLISLFI